MSKMTDQEKAAMDAGVQFGYESDGEWREGCEDCRRRTDRSAFPLQVWMEPPPVIVFECEARIAPNVAGNRLARQGQSG